MKCKREPDIGRCNQILSIQTAFYSETEDLPLTVEYGNPPLSQGWEMPFPVLICTVRFINLASQHSGTLCYVAFPRFHRDY